MITLIDGKPGGGKSYYMSRHISLNAKNYYKVFTNIDEFKYDKFNNVEQLKLSYFESLMIDAKIIFEDEDTTDKDIQDMLLEREFIGKKDSGKLDPVLIVYDEVHNILGGRNDLWLWVLTYHRHMYIDFMFATQDSSLIYSTYSKTFQKIYRALPNDRNIFALFGKTKSNRYQEHLKLPIYDGKGGTFIQNLYIKKEQKYYDLYQAGDEVRTKSVFSRFIYMFIILAGLVIIGFVWFLSHLFNSGDDKKKEEPKAISKRVFQKSTNDSDSDEKTYLKLNCFSKKCINKNLHIDLSVLDLERILKITDSQLLSSQKIGRDYIIISLLVTQDFKNLFIGATDENNKENSTFSVFN